MYLFHALARMINATSTYRSLSRTHHMASLNARYVSDMGEQMESWEGTTFSTTLIICTEIAERPKYLCVYM